MWFSLFLLIFYFFVPAPFISSVPVALGPSYHKGCTWSCILGFFFLHSYSCSLLYDLQIDPFLFKECLHIKCALSTIFPSLWCLQSTKESRADASWGDLACEWWLMSVFGWPYVCFWPCPKAGISYVQILVLPELGLAQLSHGFGALGSKLSWVATTLKLHQIASSEPRLSHGRGSSVPN